MLKKNKILSLICGIALVSGVGTVVINNDRNAMASVSESSVNFEKANDKKELIIDKKIKLTVKKIEKVEKIGDPKNFKFVPNENGKPTAVFGFEASKDATNIAIQFTFKNVSDKSLKESDLPSIKLINEKGVEYETNINASSAYAVSSEINNFRVLDNINPNISIENAKVFEVPKKDYNSGEWYILIDDEEKIKIK